MRLVSSYAKRAIDLRLNSSIHDDAQIGDVESIRSLRNRVGDLFVAIDASMRGVRKNHIFSRIHVWLAHFKVVLKHVLLSKRLA